MLGGEPLHLGAEMDTVVKFTTTEAVNRFPLTWSLRANLGGWTTTRRWYSPSA
jgi:hypothetical protein